MDEEVLDRERLNMALDPCKSPEYDGKEMLCMRLFEISLSTVYSSVHTPMTLSIVKLT